MRYAIGCSIIDKKTRKPVEGIFIESKYGAYICCDQTTDTTFSRVRIFNSAEYAVAYANKLSKTYDAEFNYRAKVHNMDRDKYRFYPVKVDSEKFPLKLIKRISIAGANQLNWEEWQFEKR